MSIQAQPLRLKAPRSRAATSTLEVVIAVGLLAAAAWSVGQFVHQVHTGLKERELSTRCDLELMNARERIGSWPVERLTLDQIQQLPLSESLRNQMTDAHLTATIQPIEAPRPATQVTLAIECNHKGQTIQPSVLTFWVPVSATSAAEETP